MRRGLVEDDLKLPERLLKLPLLEEHIRQLEAAVRQSRLLGQGRLADFQRQFLPAKLAEKLNLGVQLLAR